MCSRTNRAAAPSQYRPTDVSRKPGCGVVSSLHFALATLVQFAPGEFADRLQHCKAWSVLDISTYTGLHYNSTTHTGVVFHMIGALSDFGKMGATCVGNSPREA